MRAIRKTNCHSATSRRLAILCHNIFSFVNPNLDSDLDAVYIYFSQYSYSTIIVHLSISRSNHSFT